MVFQALDRPPRQNLFHRYAPPGRNRSRYGAHDRYVIQDLLFCERIGRFAFDRKCEPFQIGTHGIPAGQLRDRWQPFPVLYGQRARTGVVRMGRVADFSPRFAAENRQPGVEGGGKYLLRWPVALEAKPK